MRNPAEFQPAPCAEFPNDNSLLHDGALWQCSWSRAKPRAVLRANGFARILASRCAPVAASELAVADLHLATPIPSPVATREPYEAGPVEVLLAAPVNHPVDHAESDESPRWTVQLPPVSGLYQLSYPPPAPSEWEPVRIANSDEPEVSRATRVPPPSDPPVRFRVPRPEPTPRFSVPRPDDLMSALSPEVADHAVADWDSWETDLDGAPELQWMSPLPPQVATSPSATRPTGLTLNATCDDPFVLELQALVADWEESQEPAPVRKLGQLEPLELTLTPPPTAVDDPSARWEEWVRAVSGYVLSQGSPRAAALLPQLLSGRRVQLGRLSASVRAALIESGIAEGGRNRLRPVPQFVADAARYREQFLRGELQAAEYRAWLCKFLAAYLAAGDRVEIQRELERAGITRLLNAA